MLMNMEGLVFMRICCKKVGVLFLFLVTFLTACTNTNNENATKEGNNAGYVYDEITEISKNSRTAFSERGCYYLVNSILYFYDVNASVSIPVCSKMDCLHNSSSCDAYALDKADYDPYDLSGVSVECLGNMMWYNSGNIYMIKRDESGDYLMQYDSNFANEVKLLTLADEGAVVGMPSADTENTALLYNGYLYFFSVKPTNASELVDYTATVYCNRIKLKKGASVEILGTFDMAIDYALWGSGSYGEICAGNKMVYFIAGGIERQLSEINTVQYRIGCYDCSDDNFSMVLSKNTDNPEDVLGKGTGKVKAVNGDIACADDEDNLYIATDDKKIVKMSASGQVEVIYNNATARNMSSLIWDGTYVYMYEEYYGSGGVVRIDKQGNLKGRYAITINTEFCEEHKISGTLGVDVIICGVDTQNVVISTKSNYVKGLECKNVIAGSNKYICTYAVGIISKNAFDEPHEQIKSIYTYK